MKIDPAYFQMMADYNRWANIRLFSVCEKLSPDAWHQNRGVCFDSIHNCLNHLWVGDNLWMARFRGAPHPGYKLDTVPYSGFDDLWQARQAFDAEIITYCDDLTATQLSGNLDYQDSKGNLHSQPLAGLLAHFFNHQSHHRGQVHALLHQETGTAPALDLVYYLVWQGRITD